MANCIVDFHFQAWRHFAKCVRHPSFLPRKTLHRPWFGIVAACFPLFKCAHWGKKTGSWRGQCKNQLANGFSFETFARKIFIEFGVRGIPYATITNWLIKVQRFILFNEVIMVNECGSDRGALRKVCDRV